MIGTALSTSQIAIDRTQLGTEPCGVRSVEIRRSAARILSAAWIVQARRVAHS